MAAGNGPVVYPVGSLFPDIGVRHAVGRVAERLLQADEVISAFAQQIQDLANVVRL